MPLLHWQGGLLRQVGAPPPLVTATTTGSYTSEVSGGAAGLSYDWSGSNVPWAYTDPSQFTATWPAGVNIDPILTGSSDFWTNLRDTVSAANSRVVVKLPTGPSVNRFDQFRMVGASQDPLYAYGAWFQNLQGLLGDGPDKTVVEMAANSYDKGSPGQLSKLSSLTGTLPAATPIQTASLRMDGLSSASPVLIAGITFRGADQQLLTSVQPDVPAVVPQPAPYNGLFLYPGTYAQVSYCRFQAFGHALTSSPPFETGNAGIQRGRSTWNNVEWDGRLAAELNAARPRRSGMFMGNNEYSMIVADSWGHHSKVSRFALNDQNLDMAGLYRFTRVKASDITNTQGAEQPGGPSLGGYTNASLWGFESTRSQVEFIDCIGMNSNPYTNGQVAQHLQFTDVGGVNSGIGGRLKVVGGVWRNTVWPSIDNFLTVRATSSHWVSDGYATTMDVRKTAGGPRLTAYVVNGANSAWPPTAAALAAAGVTPSTHYLVRNT